MWGLNIRSWFQHLSLSRKLTALGIATSGISLMIACAVLVWHDGSNARDRLVREIDMLADVVGANSTAAMASGDARAATETLRAVGLNPHIITAAILATDGRVFARNE